jgi:DNA replication and repair protein RecF
VHVHALTLDEVRAWPHLSLTFDGSTALTGGNGVGKTTILEALGYAATLRSHRTSTDQALIRRGAERATIRVEVERTRRERIELEVNARGRNRAQLGGAPVSAVREILGVLRVSLFAPERQAIIRGEPSERRAFADELLVMLHPRYHATIREFEQVVRQRNRLLRASVDDGASLEGLDSWDASLLQLGAEVCAGRADAIEQLAPSAAASYDAVGEGSSFTVAYEPRCAHPGPGAGVEAWHAALAAKLDERSDLERIRGTTLVGPHRDDLAITIDGLPARTHASHGEGWLAALALSLGAHACIREVVHEPPVLLLDDPFTLLDPRRRERLVAALPDGQVILTAADPAEVPASLDARRVEIANATVGSP